MTNSYVDPLGLEKEFRIFARLHKSNILISYFTQEFERLDKTGVTLPDFMVVDTPFKRATEKVFDLENNPKLFESTYLTVWDKVAESLP